MKKNGIIIQERHVASILRCRCFALFGLYIHIAIFLTSLLCTSVFEIYKVPKHSFKVPLFVCFF